MKLKIMACSILMLIFMIMPADELENCYSNFEYLEFDQFQKLCLETRNNAFHAIGNNQYKDDQGNILPWYTPAFLQELLSWDIKDWEIFEWGAGYSTLWFGKHCKSVTSIESSKQWMNFLTKEVERRNLTNVTIKLRKTNYSKNHFGSLKLADGGETSQYVLAIDEDDKLYDCIIIDGFHRNSCAFHVLKHLKLGGILIVDNMDQKSLGIDSNPISKLFEGYEHHSFAGPKNLYPDWKTDYWKIN
jgi:hypothetical protein